MDTEFEENDEIIPTKTYAIVDGRIMSVFDGEEAMRQAVDKILRTDRFCVPWLSPQYGHDFEELIGKPIEYVKMEIGRYIEEAFSDDDRIESVEIISIEEVDKTALHVEFTVHTIFGDVVERTDMSL